MILINFLVKRSLSLLPKWFAKPFAKPYVAGETIEEVTAKIKSLNGKGFLATVDILGEHTKSEREAQRITEQYCMLYDEISRKNLECSVSVKPSHIGLDISTALIMKNISAILDKAVNTNNFLRIDMESSKSTDQTIQIYQYFRKKYSNIGTVLQSYLLRTQTDIDQLSELESNIRICKILLVYFHNHLPLHSHLPLFDDGDLGWGSFPADRTRLLDMAANSISNTVLLSGDVHWALAVEHRVPGQVVGGGAFGVRDRQVVGRAVEQPLLAQRRRGVSTRRV